MMNTLVLVGRSIVIGVTVLAMIFLAAPLITVIGVSFSTTEYLRFPPVGFTLKWYGLFFEDASFVQSLLLSIRLAGAATICALLLGVPAALILARKRFRGSQVLGAFFLSPLVLPTIVIGVAILQYASWMGFARTFWALLVGHVVLVIPYVLRTTLASLSGFDVTQEEAAQDLGATSFETFFLITLPQIKTGIVTGAFFSFIISWIDAEVAMFNSTPTLVTLPVKMMNYIYNTVDPIIAAISAITIYLAIFAVLLVDLAVGIENSTARRE